MSQPSPQKISRIYLLIHPVCWGSGLCEGKPPPGLARILDWMECYESEKRVRQKQNELIASMKPDEMLILFPIYREGKLMRELEEFAQETLGSRCLIIRTDAPGPGNPGFVECLPRDVLAELGEEVLEAGMESNFDWSAQALKVIYCERAYALEIQRGMSERGLTFDPETVECEAFGEGFEQCAMTWKSMLPHYLGLGKPIENNFELSVSGAPVLFKARFLERVALTGDVRVFLWEGADGRPIALYARAAARLKDRQLFAQIPLEGMEIEVRDVSHKQWWPEVDTGLLPVRVEGEVLKVPVYAATRKGPIDNSFYLIGQNVSVEEFRQRLTNATIRE